MKLLHNYVAIEREFDKESESSGIIIKEEFPQKMDTVIYSAREGIEPGDKLVYRKHTEQYIERRPDGTQRKLWFISEEDQMAIIKK